MTITINGVNDAPEAVDDTDSTNEDTVLSVPADGVLTNDTDVDTTDTKTVTKVNGSEANVGTQFALASGALLKLNEDGSYDYDPNDQFEHLQVGETATDDFTYTVTDGEGESATATVTITINGVNDAPEATPTTRPPSRRSPVTSQDCRISTPRWSAPRA